MYKLITLFTVLILTGCNAFQGNTKPQPLTESQATGIDPYTVVQYPIPQQLMTKCIKGQIEEIITGNEAVTIWFISGSTLNSIRLPHTYPLRIKFANENTFCYDYFDVTFIRN